MDEELKNALKSELKTFKETLGCFVTPDDLKKSHEELASKIEANNVEELKGQLKELNDSVEKQGLEMLKLAEKDVKEKGLDEIIAEKKDDLKKLAEGNRNINVNFELKGLTTKTNVLRTSVTDHTLAMRLPDVGQQAYRGVLMRDLFRTGRVGANSNGVIRYVDQATVTRNAAEKAETIAYPESAIAWQEYTLPVEKVADSIPVSHEMFNDVDFVASELDRLLNVNLALREDLQLYSGDGVTPNIKGIYTSASTYTAPDLALTAANLFDLIIYVQLQINSGKESKYQANTALVSYTDWNAMLATKASDGHYVKPDWAAINTPAGGQGIVVNGVRVIPSSLVTANTMLVGDFNWATIYDLEGISVEMGWINDQFTKDLMTIKAKKRLALLHRTVDATAFYKVTSISAALTLLTAP